MGNQVRIIFAPQFEPFQPYLSLPYLKELLRLYEISSSYIDCNVNFYNWLFEQKNILLHKDNKKNIYLSNNINYAVSLVKNGTNDLLQYRWSINVIEEYLQAISAMNLSISLSNIEIENKYDTKAIKEFVYMEDNLIINYFNQNIDTIMPQEYGYYFLSLAIIEQLPASLIFAKEMRRRQPNAKIAFGGPFIARFFHKLQKEKWINQIVDYLEPDEGTISIAKIFNIKQIYSGHVTPDFSEIDYTQYLSPQAVYPYLISHGCKWGKCVFCSHHLSYKSYKCSPMYKVIYDLKSISQKYGIKYFSFCDEYLTKDQLAELSRLLVSEKLNIKWSTFVRGEEEFVDDEFITSLYESGCRLLFFGFETFNQRLLNVMKKGTKATNYLQILESCKRANIAVRIDMMFGFPTETAEEAKKTYDIIVSNKNLFDTPFSSISLALFELKEDTPIYNTPEKYTIQIINSLRGNLDEVHEFIPDIPDSLLWRENLMRFLKQETDSELISPYNKAHQLILKDIYDDNLINIMPILTKENCDNLAFSIQHSVDQVSSKKEICILSNYSNGCEITIPNQLWEILKKSKNEIVAIPLFFTMALPILKDKNIIYELINFLFRSDFIVLHKSDKYEKY
jgi:radical SAM superfamily enzyme